MVHFQQLSVPCEKLLPFLGIHIIRIVTCDWGVLVRIIEIAFLVEGVRKKSFV